MKILLICNYKPGVGGISGQVELLQKHLHKEGHTADIFSTKGSAFWRMGLLSRLRKEAKPYNVLHIHCCSGWGFLPAVVGVTVAQRLKKQCVLTYHGGGGEHFFDKHPKLVHHFLTRTNANIVLSGFLAGVFEKHSIPAVTIPNILDLNDNLFRQRDALNPKYICTRAHEPLYNIPCILKAFQIVQSARPDATLTLVGDGSEHENLVQMSEELGLQNVTFTGKVDNKDIFSYLDKADILLSSPRVDNMPMSLLEAMNAGLLVISSNVGGVPYMIKNGNTGLLFESDNPAELSDKMLWPIDNQNIALTIVRQAHRKVEDYRWERIKDSLYQIYGILS